MLVLLVDAGVVVECGVGEIRGEYGVGRVGAGDGSQWQAIVVARLKGVKWLLGHGGESRRRAQALDTGVRPALGAGVLESSMAPRVLLCSKCSNFTFCRCPPKWYECCLAIVVCASGASTRSTDKLRPGRAQRPTNAWRRGQLLRVVVDVKLGREGSE